MKTGDLVRVINPLPDYGTSYTPWLENLSSSGTPVILLHYQGKGSWCEIYHDGEAKIVAEKILEVVYETE